MKIVVLAGGLCPERDVSLTSGTMICNTLRDLGHQAVLLDIYLGLPGLTAEDLEALFVMDGSRLEKPAILSSEPDLKAVKAMRKGHANGKFGENVLELCRMADICFMGLHGDIGENGMVQATLDILGVKYTGASYLSSAMAMHKGITKQLFRANDIPAARSVLIHPEDRNKPLTQLGFTLPCVVKVCSGGSSIGVFIPHTPDEYFEALDACFSMEKDVLIEEYIEGREFAVPVVAGKALPVIEIVPHDGWFDYEHKYQDGCTDEICPADIDANTARYMQLQAERACRALGIEVYARPDFLMDALGNIYCVEINTLPGMTPASLIPKSARETGMSYEELCQLIIDESMRKYE